MGTFEKLQENTDQLHLLFNIRPYDNLASRKDADLTRFPSLFRLLYHEPLTKAVFPDFITLYSC